MWLVRIKLKHNCTIGNRANKFFLIDYITFLGTYKEKGKRISVGMHRIIGDEETIKKFFKDLKKDKNIRSIEIKENIAIITERSEELPIGEFGERLFFQKPVFVDRLGYEYWEFFSFNREIINQFIGKIQKKCDFFEIKQLKEVRLTDIYFPHAIPKLTTKQRMAIEKAMEYGYYLIPRKITIRKLARLLGVSKSTYQDLLRRAENKILPDLISMNLLE